MNKDIEKAIKVLKDGGIVIFPTDTAFGIGCRIDNIEAVERLFAIRKRPETQATPVLVDTLKMAQDYLHPIPKEVIDKLSERYWPGALTIVLKSRIDRVSLFVRGGTNTLGVRIPNHKVARAIIHGVGVPILGSSANFHGEKTPYYFNKLDPQLTKLVDYVVPGECSIKRASTVIDCSQKPWKVLREGAIEVSSVILGSSGLQTDSRIDSGQARITDIILFIDTSSNQQIMVGLRLNNKESSITQKIGVQKTQVVLPLIDKLLKKHGLGLLEITQIKVNIGPGSFTGIRVGISIANALGFALSIPINNNAVGIFVTPKY